VNGEFGDVQFTRRTRDSALFVNPLMAIYFSFTLDELAQRVLYRDQIEEAVGLRQVLGRIQAFRDNVVPRGAKTYPH
jgi:hypothetical protein